MASTPAKKTATPDEKPKADVVLVQFAYATARDGEVVQLVKGDSVSSRFTDASLEHLRSIGFVGPVS